MSVAKFKVHGQLDNAGCEVEGFVEIDRERLLFTTWSKGSRKKYEVTLGQVATMVCQRVLRHEAELERMSKKRKKNGKV